VRRVALLLVALLALACAAGPADARPRTKHRKLRGQVAAFRVKLPRGLAAFQSPGAAPGAPAQPAVPGTADDADPPPLPPAPPPPSGCGRSVQVTADDADPGAFKLLLSRTTVLAGTVKITFNNAFAQDPHNLVLEGPGEAVVFDELPEGEVAVRSPTLAAGTWKVYCALEGHEALGMIARLTVAAG